MMAMQSIYLAWRQPLFVLDHDTFRSCRTIFMLSAWCSTPTCFLCYRMTQLATLSSAGHRTDAEGIRRGSVR